MSTTLKPASPPEAPTLPTPEKPGGRNPMAAHPALWLFPVPALVLYVFLSKNSKSSVALRSVFFFPTILSSVSVAFIWKFVYDPNFGLINSVLEAVGLGRFQSAYLGNDNQAIYWVALTQVWFHVGQMMIIFIAGLQQIPQELYESAETDGE